MNWGLVGIIIFVAGFTIAVSGALIGSQWRNGLLMELGSYGYVSGLVGIAMILSGWWLKQYKE